MRQLNWFFKMGQNILLIENSIAMRQLLKTVLGLSFRTKACTNCYEAAQWLEAKTVDLIVLAVPHEQHDHFGFLQHLASSSLLSDLPVLVMSENGSPAFREQCLDAGVVAFFHKPFDPLMLRECIVEFFNTVRTFTRPVQPLWASA